MQPKTQLIVITPEGYIKGLDFKNKGVQLRQFGRASIARVSEIVWCDDKQAWFIRLMQGSLAGEAMTLQIARNKCGWVGQSDDPRWAISLVAGDALYFNEYEQAVAFEVEVIQCAIRNGKSANVINA